MINYKQIKIFYTFAAFIFAFSSSFALAQTNEPSIGMTISSDKVSIDSEVEFKIFVTAPEAINAFDVSLVYPLELLELVRSRTDRSIATIWQSLPLNGQDGKVRIVGGMTESFSGKNGEIITLIFKAISKGRAELVTERADLALADGKGTLLSGGMGSLKVNILDSDNNPILIQNDELSPKISEIIISEDPATNNSLVLIRTENDGGIKELQIRSRRWLSWGAWEKSDLTASFSKNIWSLEVKTIGFDGTESTKIIYFWSSILLKIGEILLALIIGFLLLKKIKNYGK